MRLNDSFDMLFRVYLVSHVVAGYARRSCSPVDSGQSEMLGGCIIAVQQKIREIIPEFIF